MKIAITASGPNLDDQVESRFGRCPYFLLIDPDTLIFEAMPNPNISLGGGAGPQSAQLMAEKKISVVLTGNCGPNAFQTFGAAGIQVITGVGGLVREAVARFKAGQLTQATTPTVKNHFGLGGGMGLGRGRGRGGGRGMGRGMGGGMAFNAANPATGAIPTSLGNEALSDPAEIARLKQTVIDLRSQLDAIQSKIGTLEVK